MVGKFHRTWVLSLLYFSRAAATLAATVVDVLPPAADDGDLLDLDGGGSSLSSDQEPSERALIYRAPVYSDGGALVSHVEIYDDEEPADAVFDWVLSHNLTSAHRDSILGDACSVIECWRVEAVVFRMGVEVEEEGEEELVIMEGEDAEEEVNVFCAEHGLDEESR